MLVQADPNRGRRRSRRSSRRSGFTCRRCARGGGGARCCLVRADRSCDGGRRHGEENCINTEKLYRHHHYWLCFGLFCATTAADQRADRPRPRPKPQAGEIAIEEVPCRLAISSFAPFCRLSSGHLPDIQTVPIINALFRHDLVMAVHGLGR